MNAPASNLLHNSVGPDLRALRKARRMTLDEVATALNRSTGWLSQVERGVSLPTINDIQDIAAVLGCPLSMLFGDGVPDPQEAGFVVRANSRRKIEGAEGLTEELLSPDLTDDFEVLRSVFAPGAALTEAKIRATQELGHIISGKLDLQIAGRDFTLGQGDSFRIRGDAFRWSNPYSEPAVAIWVIAPPIY